MPLIQREAASNTENVDRDEQRVEVQEFAVPEWVKRVRWSETSLHANQ